MKKVNPIFILGSARNGTTWLCNTISRHENISSAQHVVHWGIHESKIFEHYKKWGSFQNYNDLIIFLNNYSCCDYFKLVKGDKKYFYKNKPCDFYEFFFDLMDNYAEKENSRYWLTKLSPRFYYNKKEFKKFLIRINKRYDNAKFISIKRNFLKVIKSYLNMEGRANQHRNRLGIKQLAIILETARYIVHYNFIEKFIKNSNGLQLTFKMFKNNNKKQVESILNYLDLKYETKLLDQKYQPNSSIFYKKKVVEINKIEKFFIKYLLFPLFKIFKFLPVSILKLRDYTRKKDKLFHFRLFKMKYLKKEFKKELKENEEFGLLKILFDEDF